MATLDRYRIAKLKWMLRDEYRLNGNRLRLMHQVCGLNESFRESRGEARVLSIHLLVSALGCIQKSQYYF